jgi:FixJ family two-component response regulator
MKEENTKYIFFVDDEPKIREVVGQTLAQSGVNVLCFENASACLEKIGSHRCDLIITDLKMPNVSGLELLRRVKSIAPWIPVLLVTGYGDIPTAVAAVKSGAADFIEKPLSKDALLRKVRSLLSDSPRSKPYMGKPLTLCEQKILKLITEGNSSREIAILLHRSLRTIEVHRSRIMCKFNVENIVELIKKAALMETGELPENTPGSGKSPNGKKK